VDITKIFVGDTYTNFADETHIDSNSLLENDLYVKTVIINPMQQGALSKIALFSVGDYTWNMSSFNNMASWKESLNAVLGKEKAPVFESIVPYLRYYDAKSPLAALIEEFKTDYSKNSSNVTGEALKNELKRIINACEVIETLKNSNSASDTLFYADVRPWLLKLKSMATNADSMLSVLLSKDNTNLDIVHFAKSWSAIEGVDKNGEHRFDIIRGMGSDITLSVQTAKPAAESLKPFIDWLLIALEEKYK
jgi:hyaluronoglucosaminidase